MPSQGHDSQPVKRQSQFCYRPAAAFVFGTLLTMTGFASSCRVIPRRPPRLANWMKRTIEKIARITAITRSLVFMVLDRHRERTLCVPKCGERWQPLVLMD